MLGKNVITLCEQTEWVETLEGNHNLLCPINKEKIISFVNRKDIPSDFALNIFDDGKAAKRIIEKIK